MTLCQVWLQIYLLTTCCHTVAITRKGRTSGPPNAPQRPGHDFSD